MTNEEIKAGVQEGRWEANELLTIYDVRINGESPRVITEGIFNKANALLFVDAGNTVQECGMLPSELWQEVLYLRECYINKAR